MFLILFHLMFLQIISEVYQIPKMLQDFMEINALTYNRKGVHKDKTYRRDLDPYSKEK